MNKSIFEALLLSMQDFVVQVEYTVNLVPNEGKNRRRNGESRTLTHNISTLDVAAKLMRGFA